MGLGFVFIGMAVGWLAAGVTFGLGGGWGAILAAYALGGAGGIGAAIGLWLVRDDLAGNRNRASSAIPSVRAKVQPRT